MRQQIFEEKLQRIQKAYRDYHAAVIRSRRNWLGVEDAGDEKPSVEADRLKTNLLRVLHDEVYRDLR